MHPVSRKNHQIVRMQFGSHVYGTNVETSDLDFKSVFIPAPYDIVMQRAQRHQQTNTKQDKSAKNSRFDVDEEAFSVQAFLRLLAEGQTVAIDMLFTPKDFYVGNPGWEWDRILENRDRFLHRGTVAFVCYAKQQAAKYGVKGSRVSALKLMIDALSLLPQKERKLLHYRDDIDLMVQGYRQIHHEGVTSIKEPLIMMVDCRGPNGKQEPHLQVCNRKIPMHATVGYTVDILTKVLDGYGQRALAAERNEGVDWKALMHAVRVSREAIELLTTANVTFPRPERELLLKIRRGEMSYQAVAEIIEEGLILTEQAQEKSDLPDQADMAKIDQLVYTFHLNAIDQARILR